MNVQKLRFISLYSLDNIQERIAILYLPSGHTAMKQRHTYIKVTSLCWYNTVSSSHVYYGYDVIHNALQDFITKRNFYFLQDRQTDNRMAA